MKKNYFMLAAATMMLAACAETDLVNEVNVTEESKQEAISFESFANKTTRAEINEETLKDVGFKVWGYKTYNNGDSYTVFDGVDVTWNDESWGYTDTQYWDETATYNFYAVAPAEGEYSITNGMIKISNVESAISTKSKDYLIDRAGNTENGSNKDIVEFDFNHIMAKLSFVLQAGVTENITVTSLRMEGWNNAKGTFTQKLNSTPDNVAEYSEWELAEPSENGSFTLVGSGASQESVQLPSEGTAVSVEDKFIVVPQSIAGNDLKFIITYTIGDETNSEIFTEQEGTLSQGQVWGTDTHITYTIIVKPNKIEFDVNSVAGFKNSLSGGVTIE